MNFGDALLHLENGRKVHRAAWLRDVYIHVIEDAAAARAIVWTPQGVEVVRWAPTSDDLLAHDWAIWAFALEIDSTQ